MISYAPIQWSKCSNGRNQTKVGTTQNYIHMTESTHILRNPCFKKSLKSFWDVLEYIFLINYISYSNSFSFYKFPNYQIRLPGRPALHMTDSHLSWKDFEFSQSEQFCFWGDILCFVGTEFIFSIQPFVFEQEDIQRVSWYQSFTQIKTSKREVRGN